MNSQSAKNGLFPLRVCGLVQGTIPVLILSLTTLGFALSSSNHNSRQRVALRTTSTSALSKGSERSLPPSSVGTLEATIPDELFSFDPTQVARGSSHTITIISNNCDHNKFEDSDKVILKVDIDALKSNKRIEISAMEKKSDCKFMAEMTVADDALFGGAKLYIHYLKDGKQASDSITLTVVKEEPLPPGPLVPGLPPQVDIMWSVVPQKIVKDNFGARVGKLFYCIEVVIGNDTGYDLQIASVGFQLGPVGKAATTMSTTYKAVTDEMSRQQKEKIRALLESGLTNCQGTPAQILDCQNKKLADLANGLKEINESQSAVVDAVQKQAKMLTQLSQVAYGQKIPVSSYRMTRGSIEHGQFLSFRNLGLNGIRTLGPILTGFVPFFHVLNHKANFSQGINIFNNPIEKGFEILVPDETITQMQRLDEDMLRDGMIVQNNRQIRTRVFIPKDILRLDRSLRDDPMMVTQALGEMYLIGDTIQFINRISVTSTGSGEVIPPPTVNPEDRVFVIDEERDQNLNLTGTNLEGAKVTSPDPNIVPGDPTVNKTSLQAKLKIKDTASRGGHAINVTTKSGTVFVPLTLKLLPPSIESEAVFADPALTAFLTENAKRTFGPVTFTGHFLQEAGLIPLDTSGVRAEITKTSPDGKSIEVKFTVPEELPDGNYKFSVANPDNVLNPPVELPNRTIAVRVVKRGVPAISSEAGNLKVSFENGPRPVRTNPVAETPVTLIVEGPNLNHLDSAHPVVQKEGETATFKLDASSVEAVSSNKVRIKLNVPTKTPANTYHFVLQNEVGKSKDEIPLKVEAQDDITGEVTPKTITATGQEQALNIVMTGSNLLGLTVTFSSTPADATKDLKWQVDKDKSRHESNGEKLTMDVKAPAMIKAGDKVVITLMNSNGKPVTREIEVVAPPAPTILGFSVNGGDERESASAKSGDTLVIVGRNLKGISEVKFGETVATPPASDITDSKITVKVPEGLTAGAVVIKIKTPGGDATTDKFTVLPKPTITGFSVNGATSDTASGKVGGTVIIVGQNLKDASKVTFGTTDVTPTTKTDTQITFTVPVGAVPGTITIKITTPGGEASTDKFTVTQ